MPELKLCVNVDHVATIRQQRNGSEPDPVKAAFICEQNGADGITVHLREDRRHIQDKDVFALKETVRGKYSLEMALSDEIILIAKKVAPDQITLVPEKRHELTTEGGLDVNSNLKKIRQVVEEFHDIGVLVSLFIEPDKKTIELSRESGADFIELHTGTYCNVQGDDAVERELSRIQEAAQYAQQIGIRVNAGHGLDVGNVRPICQIKGLEELHIGYSIIAQSIFMGLPEAVKKMKTAITSL